MEINHILQKRPNLRVFSYFLNFSGNTENQNCFDFNKICFDFDNFDYWKSRNLGDWQMLNFDFKNLKMKNVLIAWPYLCLKPPFYGDFSGIFINYIGPKTAEKARCQFPWPLFWPCKFSVFKHQRHLWTALYNRAKSSISFSWRNTPNWGKKHQNMAWFYFQHTGIAENLK